MDDAYIAIAIVWLAVSFFAGLVTGASHQMAMDDIFPPSCDVTIQDAFEIENDKNIYKTQQGVFYDHEYYEVGDTVSIENELCEEVNKV
jgi:hypothetical protein